MLDVTQFPMHFRAYKWDKKHRLYGYPKDSYPDFEWIAVLERRFRWLKINYEIKSTASIYLLKEMVQWGGSQNGTLQKFEDGIEQHNLQELLHNTIADLGDTKRAITAALKFPGMGLTYASKLLRFLDPERYGALDSRLRDAFIKRIPSALPAINGSTPSMVTGYVAFTDYIDSLKTQLDSKNIHRPECRLPTGHGSGLWRSADVEMALFHWAKR